MMKMLGFFKLYGYCMFWVIILFIHTPTLISNSFFPLEIPNGDLINYGK